MSQYMCPHCGRLFDGYHELIPYHDWPLPTRQLCPGSKQIPRCPESDARPLWNGERNPHFGGEADAAERLPETSLNVEGDT